MLNYCVSANGVNLFKQIIDIYLIRAGETHMTSEWTVDKSIASLSTCHLEDVALDENLLNSCLRIPQLAAKLEHHYCA